MTPLRYELRATLVGDGRERMVALFASRAEAVAHADLVTRGAGPLWRNPWIVDTTKSRPYRQVRRYERLHTAHEPEADPHAPAGADGTEGSPAPP